MEKENNYYKDMLCHHKNISEKKGKKLINKQLEIHNSSDINFRRGECLIISLILNRSTFKNIN